MQTPPKILDIPAGLCKRKAYAADLFHVSCRAIEEVDTASVERCGFFWRERSCAESAASCRQESLCKELRTLGLLLNLIKLERC